jgi:hypothetical protein
MAAFCAIRSNAIGLISGFSDDIGLYVLLTSAQMLDSARPNLETSILLAARVDLYAGNIPRGHPA